SEDVIDKASNDIVAHYQQQGFNNASVDVEEKLANNVWTTTFHISPGEHFRLAAVTFTGNQKVPDKTLAGIAQTSTTGGFRTLLSTLFRRPTGGVARAQ